MLEATAYRAQRALADEIEIVQLCDTARNIEVSIAPPVGNMAYEMKVNGKNILWSPFSSPAQLGTDHTFCCIPFLAPWANRLDGLEYWVDGTKYLLNERLGNLRRDSHGNPIHGLLNFSPLWKVADTGADAHSAWVTSRLDFWRYPELMAQFPFAHTLGMTYRLASGELQVETEIGNLSSEPLPIAIGFHPYLRLHDASRDQWKVHLAARDHLALNPLLIPTGDHKPIEFADVQPLQGVNLDDVFSNLVRGADGRARFWVEGKQERITVIYGPKYRIAVVYSPAARDFICFEPMAAVTNAFNLAHAGIYHDLETIPPGATWKESFWIAPTGF